MAIAVFYDEVQAHHDPAFFLVRGRPQPSPERAAHADRKSVV
jgi:hypothetical protein